MLNDDLRTEPLLRNVPDENGRKLLGPVVLSAKIGADEKRSIYRGRHTRLGLDVAVECYEAPKGLEGRELLDTLRRSAQIASRVVHPNLRRVIDVGARFGLIYLVLEYVPGETARARVERFGPRSSGEAATIVLHAARGVAAAHAEGLAHGSIGPYGVRITPDGKVKVADLGFSRRLPLDPRQDVDKLALRSDVVALGALLAFLVTGHSLPMVEATRLRAAFPEVPSWVIELIELCLGGGEGTRPDDASALVRAIESKLSRESSLAEPGSAAVQPVQTKGTEELRRLHRDDDARAQQLLRARERKPPRSEMLPSRSRSEVLNAGWGESDVPDLLTPLQAKPLVAPKPGTRPLLASDVPLTRPAAPPPRGKSRGMETLARHYRPLLSVRRKRWWAAVALVLCCGCALAAIPLWNAWRASSVDREAESVAAFDALLARLRKTEIDFAAGLRATDAWNEIESTRRDLDRWAGAPEKRRLVQMRLDQVVVPIANALQAVEIKGVDVRLEAAEIGAQNQSIAANSKQLLGSRKVEISWRRSGFFSEASLTATLKGEETPLSATIVDRGERQFATLALASDGDYQMLLERRGMNWPPHQHAFAIDVDTEAPVVTLRVPAEGAHLELTPGLKIRVEGTANDRNGLQSVALRWRGPRGPLDEVALATKVEARNFSAEFEPPKLESGSYSLWIFAEDKRGNVARIERKVAVIAVPSKVDPAVQKPTPELELEGPVATNKTPVPSPEAGTSKPDEPPVPQVATGQSNPSVEPSKPTPIGASSPATAGDRAMNSGERPQVPSPEREPGKIATPVIDISFPELVIPDPPTDPERTEPPPESTSSTPPAAPAFLAYCEPLAPDVAVDATTGLPLRIRLREVGIELCLVLPPANGEFMMGTYPNVPPSVEVASQDHPRKVRIEKPYYLGLYEIREVDWERVMGAAGTRARFESPTERPAMNLSFADAQNFVDRVNAKLMVTQVVELPDEVRWEWAARGAERTLFPWGNEAEAERAQVGAEQAALAGSFPAGAALHCGALDMAGNAKEWCRGRMTDGHAERAVLRGGSFMDPLRRASSFHREQPAFDDAQPWYGFRVMLRVEDRD